MYPFKPQIMIVRFLGITPTSSAVHTTLISICQQLCYNLEIPIEEIPTDFVPLKNYFKSLLDQVSKSMFTVILLGKLIPIQYLDVYKEITSRRNDFQSFECYFSNVNYRWYRNVLRRFSSEWSNILDTQGIT